MNWEQVATNAVVSEAFITEHIDNLQEYLHLLDWKKISFSQRLSEDFIHRYANHVNWVSISLVQSLSFDFVINHISKIDIECLEGNSRCSFTEEQWTRIKMLQDWY